jgi:hypothetical protein
MTALTTRPTAAMIEKVLVDGDLSQLTVEERTIYYRNVCDSLGLNPLTKPFAYIKLNGKLTLYALRDCTDQLRKIHGVSIRLTERQVIEGVCVVQAQATDKSGRVDEATGAVSVAGLRGELLANAILKAETKAKRRVTLSIVGMGMLDESEADSIPGAAVEAPPPPPPRQPLGLANSKSLSEPAHDAETGEVAERPEVMELEFPKNGSANATTWRAYARTVAEEASKAPDRDWLMAFQICNTPGMDALKAASTQAHTWLTGQMNDIARRLPAEEPENMLAAG